MVANVSSMDYLRIFIVPWLLMMVEVDFQRLKYFYSYYHNTSNNNNELDADAVAETKQLLSHCLCECAWLRVP